MKFIDDEVKKKNNDLDFKILALRRTPTRIWHESKMIGKENQWSES